MLPRNPGASWNLFGKISDYFSNKFSNNMVSAQRTSIRTLLGDFHYAPGPETKVMWYTWNFK